VLRIRLSPPARFPAMLHAPLQALDRVDVVVRLLAGERPPDLVADHLTVAADTLQGAAIGRFGLAPSPFLLGPQLLAGRLEFGDGLVEIESGVGGDRRG
jgi:hypothetical protein